MGQPRSAEYWHPTSAGYAESVHGLMERVLRAGKNERDEREARDATQRAKFGEAARKILTSERRRISHEEAYEKHWAWREMEQSISLTSYQAAVLIGGREKGSVVRLFKALIFVTSAKGRSVRWTDRWVELPPGAWAGALWKLREITGMCFDTLRAALKRLMQLGLIHFHSTWEGTVTRIVGYRANRRINPFRSVRRNPIDIFRSLVTPFELRKEDHPPPEPVSAEARAALEALKASFDGPGRWPAHVV